MVYYRHWRANWMTCNPCLYHYDYILHLETFSRDSAAVLKQVLPVQEVLA